LLALLLIHANQVLSTDRILEEIWGDDQPGGGRRTLQVHISKLRRALEPDRESRQAAEILVTRSGGYALVVDPDRIDAVRFEHLIERARQVGASQPERASATLSEALAMWRGEPYEDFGYESFAQGEIRRLEELKVTAIEDRLEADLATGRHAESVGELRALTQEHPLRERFWRLLMLSLYRSGRQGDALRAYQGARKHLGDELGIEPSPELRRLEEEILFQDPSLQLAHEPAGPLHNLPARVTTFLGRDEELSRLNQLLPTARQVTLIGVGGVGKTSLAIEAARDLAGGLRDGAWLVDLAPLREPDLVVQAVADVLGLGEVRPAEPLPALADRIRAKQLLLVLDNCEHLVQASADLVDSLLRTAPGVAVLATSRQALQMPGETIWQVQPLAVPSADDPSGWPAAEAGQYDAVRLFEARARAAGGDFVLDDVTAPAVVEICRRLDGIPLALELAAAQTAFQSAGEIAGRLTDRLAVVTGGGGTRPARHRTLRSMIEWSYDLLEDSEQALFDRLSVFESDFSVAAAEAVGTGGDTPDQQLVDLLGRLVSKSMVVAAPGHGAETRFRVLETLRDYGRERLEERGETIDARSRHMGFYGDLVEQAEDALRTQPRSAWMNRLQVEYPNIRVALEWSLDNEDIAESARFAGGLSWLWHQRLHTTEGWRWLERMLADAPSAPPAVRLRILRPAASASWGIGDLSKAQAICDETVAVARSLGDREGLADGLFARGRVALSQGEAAAPSFFAESAAVAEELGDRWRRARAQLLVAVGEPEARASLEAGLAVFRAAEDGYFEAVALSLLGRVALAEGDLGEAKRVTGEAISLLAMLGYRKELPYSLYQLSAIHRLEHELAQAAAFGSRALDVAIGFEQSLLISKALMHLAAAASEAGLWTDAARLFGASDAIREGMGATSVTPWERSVGVGDLIAATEEALGPEAFAGESDEGAALSLAQATDLGYRIASEIGVHSDAPESSD
jgi:predicted ATPase/DNA-binding SARP family transcriptional activator